MDDGLNEVGQNIQQSNLSVIIDVMLIRQGDLMTYYSLEKFSWVPLVPLEKSCLMS